MINKIQIKKTKINKYKRKKINYKSKNILININNQNNNS
jgi:hypothetical protein